MKKQRIKKAESVTTQKTAAKFMFLRKLKNGDNEEQYMSIRFQIMMLCLISVVFIVATISTLILPQVTRIETENTTVHMNDFVSAQSKQVMNQIKNMKQTMNNIAITSTSTMGSTNALDPYKQITRQMKVYANQNQMNSDYAVMVDENHKIVASTKDSYVGLQIDDELYQTAYVTGDETKLTTIIDEKTGNIKLVISYQLVLEKKEDEIKSESEIPETDPNSGNGQSSGEGNEESKDETPEENQDDQIVRTKVMFYYYVSNETIQTQLLDYTLNGIPDPKLTIVDHNGTLIASSDESQMGQITDNEVVLKLIHKMQNGEELSTEADYGIYTKDGKDVGVSYIYMPETNWIMTVSALNRDVYSDVYKIKNQFILSAFTSIVLASVIIFFLTKSFSKPIEEMNQVIGRVAKLEFDLNIEDKKFKKIRLRRDEIGAIGRSIVQMITVMKEQLSVVNDSSMRINHSAYELQKFTNEISEKASDTSAITEEISAGMEETTASTEVIASDVSDLKQKVTDMKQQITDGSNFADEIINRAESLITESIQAEKSTRSLFGNIKQRGQLAMEQSKAVKQIDEFAKVIQSIAGQTSLLALNASIEAARAGDAGRGFSVVAQEIGSLAQQSSDTVRKITEMVKEVNQAVANITECLNTSQDFVENNVYGDYENMQNILKNYGQDVKSIYDLINQIDTNATYLEKTTFNITDSIQAINQTLQESAIGIADIASRNSAIGELTSDINEKVTNTEEIAITLKESVDVFQL